MLELVVFFALALFLVACFYSPEDRGMRFTRSCRSVHSVAPDGAMKVLLPEDSMLRRHFLTQLQSEIESALFPRPTDSVLQRHYDSLVAVELRNRLDSYR